MHAKFQALFSGLLPAFASKTLAALGLAHSHPSPRETGKYDTTELALASGGQGCWDWHPQSGQVRFNAPWAALLGYALGEIEPNIAFFIRHLHPADRPAVMERLTGLIEGRLPVYESEHRLLSKDGQWKWVMDRGKVVEWDTGGHALRVTGACMEIGTRPWAVEALEKRVTTPRRPPGESSGLRFLDLFDLEEIQKIQDAFSDATGVASIITDARGKPITQPSNFCLLCKLIRGTAKGRLNCYRSDAALGRMNPAGPIIAPCLSGGLYDGGASICAGDEHIANWLIGQVRDETIDDERIVAYAREIGADEKTFRQALHDVPLMSKERFAQIARALFLIAGQMSTLALKNVQQARAIHELNRVQGDLQRAKEIAEAASRAKDQFIATLSHEVRTPLTPVLMAVATLEESPGLPPECRPDLELIRRNVELEARLIDDLLDVTRITRGKIEIARETMDVHACFLKAFDICKADIAAKRLQADIRLEAPLHFVRGDPARLQQVFWNLLKNAVKFTPDGGQITVRSSNEKRRLKVDISDTGIGIAAEHIARIFNAFEQVEQTRSRRFGGLGLGLSIAKTVVELHRGTLTCQSDGIDKGATFTVELAAADTPSATLRPSAEPPPPPEKQARKILLVEDHPDTLRILARILEKWGYRVTTADSVATARSRAAEEPFDALISDLGLPDGSGLEIVCEMQKQHPIPSIALSGFGTEADLRQSREAGFEEHLVKPVAMEMLQEALQRICARLP